MSNPIQDNNDDKSKLILYFLNLNNLIRLNKPITGLLNGVFYKSIIVYCVIVTL